MALRRYGELGGRAGNDDSDPPRALSDGGRAPPGTAAFLASWLATSRATEHRNTLQGEVMPCRLWAMKNRRVAGA